MAQTAQRVVDASPANDVQAAAANPVAILTEEAKFEAFFAHIKAETDGLQADVSTKRGRDAIAAMAYKVSQTKQSIEKARLALTEEWRSQTSKVNAAGKVIAQRLDDLRDEVRAPLTAWEAKDKQRIAGCEAMIKRLSQDAVVQLADTSEGLRARHDAILALEFEEEVYQEFLDQAVSLKNAAIATLELAIARLEKEEADRAELQRLREAEAQRQAEQAERERQEEQRREEERQAAERERAAAEERERIERERVAAAEAAAQAERDRAAREAREREEAAERERQAELDRIEAERAAERQKAAEELAASNARIAEAERQAQAERDAAAERERQRAERERQAEAERQRLADEQAARERDLAHKGKVNGEAQAAIVALGVKDAVARNIVLAIAAGTVPHVRISY